MLGPVEYGVDSDARGVPCSVVEDEAGSLAVDAEAASRPVVPGSEVSAELRELFAAEGGPRDFELFHLLGFADDDQVARLPAIACVLVHKDSVVRWGSPVGCYEEVCRVEIEHAHPCEQNVDMIRK
ncbi:unnamed protein product [Linum trigynum]|uniref:Uncharacterized protein n=1 Tax=Linum trigynum TaxID=586398 RepID=A0AAV2G161_9ROSI